MKSPRCSAAPAAQSGTSGPGKPTRTSASASSGGTPENVNGNSGVLVHTTGPDKIWPRSIQVQLHAPKAGSILTHDGARTDNKVNVNDRIKDPRKWNDCVITCQGARLTVEINGKQAGSVTGCLPNSGHLALQSEGSEVHFRNIRVDRLKQATATRPE